ncbi:hypothetical protein GCM10011374_30040 [Kocuria dechangensis]|uniref:Uncharacterized protein n=1 Tax=Kocuria dechangensis TaxID=1176249 RepID=A0A917H1E3_9MICC|nr:hypothetical protein [Kocuria dechangensis]GGG64419.1 hypothetical protein GCM10011374_30040 [Kocuria dechangensis]
MVLLIPQGHPYPGSAGYAAALAVQETRTISEPSTLDDPEALRADAIVIRPQQLKDWVLTDLQDLDATR